MITRCLLAVRLTVLSVGAVAAEVVDREGWIRKRVAQMEAMEDLSKVPLAGFVTYNEEPDAQGMFTYHTRRSGRIHCADGSWVIVASHSAHWEEAGRSRIGDVTVARTSAGKFYVNPGHCCPQLGLRSPVKIESLATFLAATGMVPKEKDGKWVEYKKVE